MIEYKIVVMAVVRKQKKFTPLNDGGGTLREEEFVDFLDRIQKKYSKLLGTDKLNLW